MHFLGRIKQGLEKPKALDMVYVEMRQEDIDPLTVEVFTEIEIGDSTTGIKNEQAAIFLYLDAGCIASIQFGVRVDGGYGSTDAPERDLHSSDGLQNMATAPTKMPALPMMGYEDTAIFSVLPCRLSIQKVL